MSPWSLKIATPVVNPIPKNRQVLYARIGCDATLTYCSPLVEVLSLVPGIRMATWMGIKGSEKYNRQIEID